MSANVRGNVLNRCRAVSCTISARHEVLLCLGGHCSVKSVTQWLSDMCRLPLTSLVKQVGVVEPLGETTSARKNSVLSHAVLCMCVRYARANYVRALL